MIDPFTGNYLRVRGEYLAPFLTPQAHPELPPRARRIRPRNILHSLGSGTTSACAENTVGLVTIMHAGGNYLRVRGEYWLAPASNPHAMELPPRARRIQQNGDALKQIEGTTSACAENTRPGSRYYAYPRNYLRVRGEYPK